MLINSVVMRLRNGQSCLVIYVVTQDGELIIETPVKSVPILDANGRADTIMNVLF